MNRSENQQSFASLLLRLLARQRCQLFPPNSPLRLTRDALTRDVSILAGDPPRKSQHLNSQMTLTRKTSVGFSETQWERGSHPLVITSSGIQRERHRPGFRTDDSQLFLWISCAHSRLSVSRAHGAFHSLPDGRRCNLLTDLENGFGHSCGPGHRRDTNPACDRNINELL